MGSEKLRCPQPLRPHARAEHPVEFENLFSLAQQHQRPAWRLAVNGGRTRKASDEAERHLEGSHGNGARGPACREDVFFPHPPVIPHVMEGNMQMFDWAPARAIAAKKFRPSRDGMAGRLHVGQNAEEQAFGPIRPANRRIMKNIENKLTRIVPHPQILEQNMNKLQASRHKQPARRILARQ
ncbi:hypothetical protein [Mesorhizobium sp. J18]|uniref:hypothetical protein n=1 Tax=Mesorhizobium sp. J18 TaxID=935263 RepID=UPI0011A6D0DD|nr:hypothetical protein [Mesorhizobium sp. J18]